MDFVHLVEDNEPVANLLNEAVPDLGLERSGFDKVTNEGGKVAWFFDETD